MSAGWIATLLGMLWLLCDETIGQRQVLLSEIPSKNKPMIVYSVRDEHATIPACSSNVPGETDSIAQHGSSLVPCSQLSHEFVICKMPRLKEEVPKDHNDVGNVTEYPICPRFGGSRLEEVAWVNVSCTALDCIECAGPRTFIRERPCIRYTGHYFLSTLLYSIFMGILAVDRFCLGYSAIAVGKLMTLGGLGVWWVIDIFLLASGNLMPADQSSWEPYY